MNEMKHRKITIFTSKTFISKSFVTKIIYHFKAENLSSQIVFTILAWYNNYCSHM